MCLTIRVKDLCADRRLILAVKLILTWDILPGQEQEYFEFVVRDFIPGMQKLGMEPSDAWFTMYGDQPQIMAAVQTSN